MKIIMDDYEHYVFYLNGSGEWLHSIQMILDSQIGSWSLSLIESQ